MKALFALIILLSSLSSLAQGLEFKWNDKTVRTFSVKDFEKGVSEARKESVYNPFRKYTKTYHGADFFALLDRVYGPKWRSADSIRFMATDGLVQQASVRKMLERGADHSGLLAYGEDGRTGFSSFEKNGKEINPGPFYLVWTKFDGWAVASYEDHLKWPYQLRSVVIVGKNEK